MDTKEVSFDSKYVLLHRLRRELRKSGLNLNNLLHQALAFLHRETKIEAASVFLVEESSHTLKEYLRLEKSGDIASGEHQEPLWKGSVLHALIAGEKNVYVAPSEPEDPFYSVFVRLGVDAGSKTEFPTQGILQARIARDAKFDLLLAWCEEVGEWLELSMLEQKLKNQSQQIESFSELSWLFVTSLRLEDRLRLILEGMERLFHFDRIRLYLVDPMEKNLKGEVEINLSGEIKSLTEESYSLEEGESVSLIELLNQRLRLDPWSRILEHSLDKHDKVLYIALKIQHKEIGVLVVDNLLSQEPISRDVRNLLQSFAGQIALAVDNARLFGEVEKLSLYDALSHLPNRRFFDMKFSDELYRASRSNSSFAVCLLDLDFFKEINDTYGHQMGDRAIKAVAQTIQTVVRQSDFAARWGGDEISILLANTTEEEAKVVVERILNAVREIILMYPASPPKELKITASIGVAVYPQDGATLETITASADRALYQVKFRGRNGFIFHSQVLPEKS